MRRSIRSIAAAAVAAGFMTSAALAFDGSAAPTTGPVAARIDAGVVSPSQVFKNASVGTGGTGLRNRSSGSITVSEVVGPIRAAFLYWAVITYGKPPAAAARPYLQRAFPDPTKPVRLSGQAVGTGASPCWGGSQITVFRATVPVSLRSKGAGTYTVIVPKAVAGSTGGQSPWAVRTYPMWEGAELVMIGKGVNNVEIYDRKLSGKTVSSYGGHITYKLKTGQTSFSSEVVWYNIGADGQFVLSASHASDSTIAGETTTINGYSIAGDSASARDSDWNGRAGGPFTQLWDSTRHYVTNFVNGGNVSIDVNNQSDCLTPVANILTYR